jgi:hypothetical protein
MYFQRKKNLKYQKHLLIEYALQMIADKNKMADLKFACYI